MAKTYKIWIHVEEHDSRTDEYRDLDLHYSSAAHYSGHNARTKAEALAEKLQRIAKTLA